MAGVCTVTTYLSVTGIDHDVDIPEKTTATVPVVVVEGSPTVGTTSGTLDLGDITAGKPYILYFKAIVGNFYLKLGATSGDPVLTDSHLYILAGEGYAIPINPNSTAMTGIRYIGSIATTSKFYYCVVGKA